MGKKDKKKSKPEVEVEVVAEVVAEVPKPVVARRTKPTAAQARAAKAAEVEAVEAVEPDIVEGEPDNEENVEVVPNEQNVQYTWAAETAQADPAMYAFFNRLLDVAQIKTAHPAVSETCSCGAAITVSEAVPEADRKRMHNAWLRRHKTHADMDIVEVVEE